MWSGGCQNSNTPKGGSLRGRTLSGGLIPPTERPRCARPVPHRRHALISIVGASGLWRWEGWEYASETQRKRCVHTACSCDNPLCVIVHDCMHMHDSRRVRCAHASCGAGESWQFGGLWWPNRAPKWCTMTGCTPPSAAAIVVALIMVY